jgi:hypothetical protein
MVKSATWCLSGRLPLDNLRALATDSASAAIIEPRGAEPAGSLHHVHRLMLAPRASLGGAAVIPMPYQGMTLSIEEMLDVLTSRGRTEAAAALELERAFVRKRFSCYSLTGLTRMARFCTANFPAKIFLQ